MIIQFPDGVPDSVFEYAQNRSLVKKFIYYMINWKNYNKSVYLKPWLKSQVDEASDNLKDLVKDLLSRYANPSNDTKAKVLFEWVRANIIYKSDLLIWKVKEYWQPAEVTLFKRTGDCEDGAILLYVMCRLAGVPSNRLFLFCGDVEGGGHCWLAYKPNKYPINFVFLDWCYWPSSKSMAWRDKFWVDGQKIRGQFDKYYNIWWCFNEDGTYLEFKQTGE